MSVVGTAVASTPGDDITSGHDSGQTPSTSSATDSGATHNGLWNVEAPHVNMGQPSSYTVASHGNNDDRDGVCHGLGGKHTGPDNFNLQVPCQSKDNSFGKGNVNGHHVDYTKESRRS
ncbi:MAG TPA: hypothetical protein VGH99_17855 [Pseudonocardia sp.]|jgi:hypothetical protein